MRINNIQTTCKPQQTGYKRNLNTTNITNTTNKQDVFISTNNISFGARTFDSAFKALKKDIVNYVTNTNSYDEKSIEQILQRYYPNAICKEMEREHVGDSGTVSHGGNTKKVFVIQTNLLGNKKAILENQTIDVVFPKNNSVEEKILFASRLIHESTHMLQGCCAEKETDQKAIDKFILKNNFETLKENLSAANWIYQSLNDELLELSMEAINSQSSKDKTSRWNVTATAACNDYFQETPEEMAQEMLDGVLNKYHKLDRDFILDYCTRVAKCEIEAYSKEIEFLKEYGYDHQKTFNQIKIELNVAIIDAIATMKK